MSVKFFNLLVKLGLKFQDPDMEISYQQYQTEMEKKLLNVSNIISISLSLLNLILGLVGSREAIAFRIVLLVMSLFGAVIKLKFHFFSKLILLFTSIGSFYVITNTFTKFVDFCSPESYYLIGNAFGLAELVFTLSFGNFYLKVTYSLILFCLKVIILKNGLIGRVPIRFIGMTILYIIFYLYYVSRERKTYQSIYSSREQLKKFRSLLSNDLPSSVLIMSSNFDSIMYSNHFFKDKFGSNPDIGFVLSILTRFQLDHSFPIDSNSKTERNLYDFVQKLTPNTVELLGKGVITLSAVFQGADTNNMLHYEIKIRQISWDSKLCYALIFNDMSDKQLIVALKIADEHKDRIVATVSHELRTPINGIMGLLNIISSRVTDTISQTYLNYCKSCSKLLLHLVNSILDLSQIHHNKLQINKQYFDLNDFLEELKSLYLFQAQEKNIQFIIKKAPDVPNKIETDKFRLIEVLINLLGNAFKFTSKGSISLNVSRDYQSTNRIRFSVSDTGVGIKEEDKSKLFTMFGKLNQENKNINAHGVGLGLTIANELVIALNDNDITEKIGFQSDYGRGSEFYFKIIIQDLLFFTNKSFELENSEPEASSLDEINSELASTNRKHLNKFNLSSSTSPFILNDPRTKETKAIDPSSLTFEKIGKNVLIVDDNPFNILAASFLLEKLEFHVSKAMSGQECLQILQESMRQQKPYHLILMDIQMPIMDGLETSKIISEKIQKGELYDLPIIALTANGNSEKDVENYKKNGIVDYLAKPIKEDEIKNVLRIWIKPA